MKDPNEMKLWEHAEAWQRENGRQVPPKYTPEYTAMYEAWVNWAFAELFSDEDED